MERPAILEKWLRIMKTAVAYAVFLLISIVTGLIFEGAVTSFQIYEYLTPFWVHFVIMLLQLLIFSSVTKAFAYNDASMKKQFFEGDTPIKKFSQKLIFTVKNLDFWTASLTFAGLIFILPMRFCFPDVLECLGITTPSTSQKLILSLIIIAVFIVINLFSYISAEKAYIVEEYKKKNNISVSDKEQRPNIKLLKRILFLIFIYYLGGEFLPIFIVIFINTYQILGLFGPVLWILLIAIPILIAVSFALRYNRAKKKRKEFTDNLTKLCHSKRASLSEIRDINSSILKDVNGYNFSVEHKGVKYDCKFLCGLNKNDPMFLTEKGEGSTVHAIRFRRVELFKRITTFKYDFESDGKKILIILPVPKKLFSSMGRALDVGDKVGEYKIYTATGFLNALERDCLDISAK